MGIFSRFFSLLWVADKTRHFRTSTSTFLTIFWHFIAQITDKLIKKIINWKQSLVVALLLFAPHCRFVSESSSPPAASPAWQWASLSLLQASFPGNLHLVLVLRPTSFFHRTVTDIGFRFSQEDFMLKMPVRQLLLSYQTCPTSQQGTPPHVLFAALISMSQMFCGGRGREVALISALTVETNMLKQ